MHTMKQIILAIALAALTGCASMDRDAMSSLEPTHEDSSYRYFKFTAATNAIHKDEQTRIEWLETWLRDNGMAGKPYEITTRREVVKGSTMFGPIHDIYYTVRVTK